MEKQIEKFINTLSPVHPMIYRAISKEWIPSTISEDIALTNKEKNIYFLWWLSPKATRMTDHDIDIIHYVRLDIDIKKWVQEIMEVEADPWDIEWFTYEIKQALDKNEYLKDRSYVVFSWWWCHIYYSNKEWVKIDNEVTPKVWQLAMKRIYTLYNKSLEDFYTDETNPSPEMLKADQAVCNTARIMRMPWTINQKHWVECKILYENPDAQSKILWLVKSIWLDALKKSKELSEVRKKEIEEMRKKLIEEWWADMDLKYQIINKFPAYLIVQILKPEFIYDGKKNFRTMWKMKWYWYVEQTNSICNWWSHEFSWWTTESCWDNFTIVKRELWLTSKKTFEWFEDHFKI